MATYSHSRLETYENCPLRYKFKYLDRIDRETEGVEAFLGSRVHETLQKCYDDVRYTRAGSLDSLLAFYLERWQKIWHDEIVINKRGMTQDHYQSLGEKMLGDYYRRYAPFDGDTTIATELSINFPLVPDGGKRINGYIDRLARAPDGAWEIHDYKTSAHLPPQSDLDTDRQLALYQFGVQSRWPQAAHVRLIWHYLAFDETMVSRRTPEALAGLIESTSALIDEVESARDFPPKESALCGWCDYPDLCPGHKHECKVSGLPPNEFLNEPGVDLVNRYAALKDAERALAEQLEKVKEAIVQYGEREGVNAIVGSSHRLRIYASNRLKFPGKNDPERPALDAAIKSGGRWEDVSALDTAALVGVVAEGGWPVELVDEIMKFGQYECSSVVRLAKLKEEEH